MKLIWLGLLSLFLIACGSSKVTQFYVLNPLPLQKNCTKDYANLQIGIAEVNTPAYIEKPQLMIHCTAHHLAIQETDQWAEALDKNIVRVIRANLSTLLPGAIVQSSPWNPLFKPNYQLVLTITQFDVDKLGNSLLRAEYFIYREDKLIEKRDVVYQAKLCPLNMESFVITMNNNLNLLSQDIARVFACIYRGV